MLSTQYSDTVSERSERRIELELTQVDAARQAKVSLATWRRWESDPDSVSVKTRIACEDVLEGTSAFERALVKSAEAFTSSWRNSPRLTPRQAYAIAVELDSWADGEITEWLQDPSGPLHEVAPFYHFDLRVMMLVGENRAWAEGVKQRCRVISNEIEVGSLPFGRTGPLIDEILIGAALDGAQSLLKDMPELFERIPSQGAVDEDDFYLIGDDDWDVVLDGFDDICRWDEWKIPILQGHPLLPAILAERHPFTWFDGGEASGPGYLQRLSGLVVDE
ncbi:MAG: helix-turn-helix transcriptional regulator [Corynebacterium sp.]|nr:helix-turn-helix transcriptional regulator [Corynebacterium sp.]